MTVMHDGHTLAAARGAVVDALDADNGRLVLTAPPQEGLKTSLARTVVGDAIATGQRVIYASYLEQVARNHTADLAADSGGQVRPVGVGGALTGFAADLLVVDDPLQPSASTVEHLRALAWLDQVALCRLGPGASAILLTTRTQTPDLAGWLIERGWTWVNFPVLADGRAPDVLARRPGTYLPSLRGHSPERWEGLRLELGERRWRAMYQGVFTAEETE